MDANDVLVADASDTVQFTMTGAGRSLGIANSDWTSSDPYKATSRKVYRGKALIVVQSTMTPGTIKLTVSSGTLTPADITIATVASSGPLGTGGATGGGGSTSAGGATSAGGTTAAVAPLAQAARPAQVGGRAAAVPPARVARSAWVAGPAAVAPLARAARPARPARVECPAVVAPLARAVLSAPASLRPE